MEEVPGALGTPIQGQTGQAPVLSRKALGAPCFLKNHVSLRKCQTATRPSSYTAFMLCGLVTQSSPTLCDLVDCSPPGFSMGILQARILEWVAMPSSRGSSQIRDRTHASYISCIGKRVPYTSATWETQTTLQLKKKQNLLVKLWLEIKIKPFPSGKKNFWKPTSSWKRDLEHSPSEPS